MKYFAELVNGKEVEISESEYIDAGKKYLVNQPITTIMTLNKSIINFKHVVLLRKEGSKKEELINTIRELESKGELTKDEHELLHESKIMFMELQKRKLYTDDTRNN